MSSVDSLIDSADRGTIGLLLEKRTFEEQFATCATSIADLRDAEPELQSSPACENWY